MHTLESLQKIIKEQIDTLKFKKYPRDLYDPIQYILALGGKRLRPALCLLACDMFGGDIQKALFPAIGIELFHNFTLMHDDIMDKAPIRRGKPTVHHKWNPNVAILSGDTMMALSYDYIMKAPEAVRSQVFSIFNKTAIEVCEGQQFDMNFETQQKVSIPDYIEMIRLKTAVLLAGSLEIGAVTGGATDEEAENIYRFGEKLGIAFQLKDDLLDVFSDEDKFGKKTGGDIAANKKTFLYLKALELASDKTYKTLQEYYQKNDHDPDEKIAGVKNIFKQLAVDKITDNEIDHYYHEALNYLNKVAVADNNKTELLAFAKQLKQREF